MKKLILPLATAALVASATACNFLSGGELTTNPNVASSVTAQNLFVGTQVALWNELGGDMSRVTSIWAQHLTGIGFIYLADNQYEIDENTTGGFHQGLYITGGLVDMRHLQDASRALHDSLFLGIAQVQEAWMMGEGADLFGDLVYSKALTGMSNPPLDSQRVVYTHVEALLDTAITNMSAPGGGNVGPGSVDLSTFGGDRTQWLHLAHTLKARFYMHQIHAPWTTPAAMSDSALTQVPSGLGSGENYAAQFSGSSNQQNYWYQFLVIGGRTGYYQAGATLIDTLQARHDASVLTSYFNSALNDLADSRLQAASPETLSTYVENELLWAEAAYRSSSPNVGMAVTHLINARTAHNDNTPAAVPASGPALLAAILDEKWITDFTLGTEAWTDYRRTCTPNLTPTVTNGRIPGRLYYDTGERQTNTNIPDAGQGINGAYNDGQPALATSDGTGTTCLAQ